MSFKRKRSNSPPVAPDLEQGPSTFAAKDQPDDPSNGDPYARSKQSTDRDPRTGAQQNTDYDANNYDKFWKLFQEEAVAEAKWKVKMWKIELDSLLVFAGLFAAVVSAFLIDLRLHLRPDPQLIALNQIVLLLRNDTGPVEFEKPSHSVRGVGFLWYGSLVATLIGALWCVLATGWMGASLSEPAINPVDRALERWRRDRSMKLWNMDHLVKAVPLLTQQLGLAMFLAGFVIQSFGDDHAIGFEVLVFVICGAWAYSTLTLLPQFRPEFPFRTSLTDFFYLVPMPTINLHVDRQGLDRDSMIKILVSRLNRSSNDEMFCSAAAVLDAELESHDSEKWYRGVLKRSPLIAEALALRLKSFTPLIQQMKEAPSTLWLPKDTANSGTNGQALVGNLYPPIEQGVTCLRVFLKFIEASLSIDDIESAWINQDIGLQWRSSEIYPENWRLLSLSIHITRLVAKKIDYDVDDVEGTDWENMIRKNFPDMTLRAISGASASRGLLQGEANLRKLCALGLAMFIEVEATPSDRPKRNFFEMDRDSMLFDVGKVITESLWSELVKIWKNTAIQLLFKAHSEEEQKNNSVKLLDYELYQSDIEASISTTILNQLENENWTTRKQAVQMLNKLAEHDAFQEAVETSGAIAKVIGMLEDIDEDVRAAAVRALSKFSEQYNSDTFINTIKTENGIPKLTAALADKDSDVRAAAADALLELSKRESYLPDIKLCLPAVIKILDGGHDWRIREHTVQFLKTLSQFGVSF